MPCPFMTNSVASVALEYWIHGVDHNQMGALRGFDMVYLKKKDKRGIHQLLAS